MNRRPVDTIPSPQEVRSLLDYDPESGSLTWRYREQLAGTKAEGWNSRYVGKEAGYLAADGYIAVAIHRLRYPAHVLAWVITYGEWPAKSLDHINAVKVDNRIANLRLATTAENGWNAPVGARNTTGVKHVSWHRGARKWQVRVRANGRDYSYGVHEDFDLACVIAAEAAAKHHGEFARTA